ncbi:uncharacterized protein LOC131849185 [Achroia grisella]|uniref:uncharacterized protein LOC131849185 n=1 Tax=Achroia grisella TaxID=688607 RepID=UPI0027D34BE5|nr:uncharacterized protein LOC131849185 [Achroia grisella]
MMTDEEKSKITKLLQGIDVPDIKLSERCSDLVKEIHDKYKELDDESTEIQKELNDNPYKVDRKLVDEIDRKLHELMYENKRLKKDHFELVVLTGSDPKRPWRTYSNKEKLFRIDSQLKRHYEKATQMITPLAESDMKDLVNECQKETDTTALITVERVRDTVDAAKKTLPNFQYRKVNNNTATAILAIAHDIIDTKPVNCSDFLKTEDN